MRGEKKEEIALLSMTKNEGTDGRTRIEEGERKTESHPERKINPLPFSSLPFLLRLGQRENGVDHDDRLCCVFPSLTAAA